MISKKRILSLEPAETARLWTTARKDDLVQGVFTTRLKESTPLTRLHGDGTVTVQILHRSPLKRVALGKKSPPELEDLLFGKVF